MDNRCKVCGKKDIGAFAPPHLCGPCHFAASRAERDKERTVGMGTERGSVLLDAHKIINGDRQQAYGNPEDTHAVIAELWNGYIRAKAMTQGKDISQIPILRSEDAALLMVLFKIARELNGAGVRDSAVDAAGYLGIYASMRGY